MCDVAKKLQERGWLSQGKPVEQAVREYQSWHGLLVDGDAGPVTQSHLEQPRFCAFPDAFTAPEALGTINRWGKKRLSIEVQGSLGRLSDDVFREGVITGFRLWSVVADLTFDLVPSGGDLILDTGRIDGPAGTLAYFQLPTRDGHLSPPLGGRADDDERWNQTVMLVPVIGHEGGHGLGLGHTNVPRQLMNPVLSDIDRPQPAWDVPEIQKRYGAPKPALPPAPSRGVIRMDVQDFDGELWINGRRAIL